MKYKDNNFLKFQDRQRDDDTGYLRTWKSNKSDRQIRREQEHRLSNFYFKNLSKRIEKDWWVNLKIEDKQKIEKSYYNQEQMLEEEDPLMMWSNFVFFDTWDEWYEYTLKEYKPDMIKYRESKLKKLGI
jgi:hypothetical protein